ncbi:hypothetical protein PLICRDRAFT_38343 [Plicaturopsis crispa FD-325 SS-3]|nr:hypothetical protein PLICRDRAFT_38343 [Plicaturopsis crispa FD-325 SS-3]
MVAGSHRGQAARNGVHTLLIIDDGQRHVLAMVNQSLYSLSHRRRNKKTVTYAGLQAYPSERTLLHAIQSVS